LMGHTSVVCSPPHASNLFRATSRLPSTWPSMSSCTGTTSRQLVAFASGGKNG
jgi:hypothetical protein